MKTTLLKQLIALGLASHCALALATAAGLSLLLMVAVWPLVLDGGDVHHGGEHVVRRLGPVDVVVGMDADDGIHFSKPISLKSCAVSCATS